MAHRAFSSLLLHVGTLAALSASDVPDFYSSPPAIDAGVIGYQQTTGYTCGPSSVMSLLAHLGLMTPAEMTHATEMRLASEMGTNPVNGTSASQLAGWLATYRASNGSQLRVESGTRATLALVRDRLTRGQPVVIDWIDWGGHWVVATAYAAAADSNYDAIYFADPAMHYRMNMTNNPRGVSGMNAQRFLSMWFDSVGTPGIYVTAEVA